MLDIVQEEDERGSRGSAWCGPNSSARGEAEARAANEKLEGALHALLFFIASAHRRTQAELNSLIVEVSATGTSNDVLRMSLP